MSKIAIFEVIEVQNEAKSLKSILNVFLHPSKERFPIFELSQLDPQLHIFFLAERLYLAFSKIGKLYTMIVGQKWVNNVEKQLFFS